MISNINKVIVTVLTVVFLVPSITFAEPSVSDNAGSNSPATSNPGNAGTIAPTPSTTNPGNAAVTAPTPSTTNPGNAAVTSGTPGTSNPGNAAVTSPSTGSTPSSGTPSNVTYGSGGGSSHPTATSSKIVILPTLTNISNCLYLTTYMKFGNTNDVAEVMKLQSFLKDVEKLDVDVNGNFDQKTLDAVKAFQAKYVSDVMIPWGVSTPTGQVFFTTQKKVNEIYCKSNFALTASQLAQIEAYKTSIKNTVVELTNSTSTDSMTPDVGSTDAPLKANLNDTAKPGMIKGFFKWLFGY